MKTSVVAWFVVALVAHQLAAQEVARVDLTRNKAVDLAEPSDNAPDGCAVASAKGTQESIRIDNAKLQLEMSVPAGTTFTWGSKVESEIRMRNVGSTTVLIPWTTDPVAGKLVAGSSLNVYERGYFEVELKKNGLTIPLESESESGFLYGANWAPENTLRLEPGQWIVAKFNFRLEQQRTLSALFKRDPGKGTINVSWHQIRFTANWVACSHQTGYYPYIYTEDAKPLDVNIVEASSID